jgi:hypothetical protein
MIILIVKRPPKADGRNPEFRHCLKAGNRDPATIEEYKTKKANLKYVDSDGIGAEVLTECQN